MTRTEPDIAGLRVWALISGGTGALSMLALVGFYALADPLSRRANSWSWLGPANDTVSIAYAPAQIAAAVFLWRVLPASRLVAILTALMSFALAALAVTTVMMLAGSVGFEVQALVAIPAVFLMFSWLYAVCTLGLRGRILGRPLARWGQSMGIAVPAGMLLVGVGLLLPEGSPAQWTFFILGGVPGALSWLLYPAWWITLAFQAIPVPPGSPSTSAT